MLAPVVRPAAWLLGGLLLAPLRADLPDLLLGRGPALPAVKARIAAGDPELVRALHTVRARANTALNDPLVSVTEKNLPPPGGDANDYYSLSPFWWPNPAIPDGLPYVWRDGQENPERRESDIVRLEALGRAVTALGVAWYFTGEARYAEDAARRLRVWFVQPETRMNPNFKYAQMRRGHGVTNFGGMIEASRLRWLPDVLALLETSSAWRPEEAAAVRRWFAELAEWFVTSPEGREEAMSPNNHGAWHAVHATLFALFGGRSELARPILDRATERIFVQIFPDGRQPNELIRTRSLHYSDYNNRAFVDLARLGQRLGYDLFSYRSTDGRSIGLGLDYLIPFVLGKEVWPAPQIRPLNYAGIAETYWRAAIGAASRDYVEVVRKLPDGARPDAVVLLLDPMPEEISP